MSNLLLIRGLPGSGKSTLAKELSRDYGYHHLETDMWFTNTEGEYNFDPSKLGLYHDRCLKETARLLENGENVIVSNTFSTYWELNKYADILTTRDSLCIIQMNNMFKSIHNVPDEAIACMTARWEDVLTDGIQLHHRVPPTSP